MLLVAFALWGCDGDGDETAAPLPDPDEGYREVPLEAGESYLARRDEYLGYCHEHSGPGVGGLYGQLCRVLRGDEVYVEAIESACDKLEARQDTADFSAAALVRMLYLDRDSAALDADTGALVEQTLLDFKYWIDEPGQDQMCYWTENHQGLFHSSELLAGQLFPDQVFSNDGKTGAEHAAHAEPLVERWLDFRGRFGFSEWHSNVYFNEDIPALVNLADFAASETIRTKAAAVLDLVAFDLLNNSYRGYFATVHGRTYEDKFLDGLSDSTTEASWIMTGLGSYESTGNFSATFLATSESYFTPEILEQIATAAAAQHEHRQRDGIDVLDGPGWGVGYQEQSDVIFWAGMSALIAPEVIEGTFAMVEELDLWEGFLFGEIPEEIMLLIDMAIANETLPDLATQLEPMSRGICLEAMDTYAWRTPNYQLAGGQDYNPGLWASQTQLWQATLDAEAYVFTSYPSDLADAGLDAELAGSWIGSWLPRATFHQNVGVIQYQPQDVPIADAYISSDHTHAFFPRDGFDELIQQGGWTFGQKGEGFVALYSENPTSWAEDNSYELDAEGETNTWIVELGSGEEWSTFEAFVTAIAAAEVQIDDSVRYESPSVGTVQVGWEGPMTVAGVEVDLGPFPRWSNAYASVEHGAWSTRVDLDDRRLLLDFESGRRALLQRD